MASKRRKPKAERKEAQIRIAVTPDQKKKLTDAAAKTGQGVRKIIYTVNAIEPLNFTMRKVAKSFGRS